MRCRLAVKIMQLAKDTPGIAMPGPVILTIVVGVLLIFDSCLALFELSQAIRAILHDTVWFSAMLALASASFLWLLISAEW